MAQKKPIVLDASLWRGIVSIAVFVFLWQIGSMSKCGSNGRRSNGSGTP